MTTVRRTVTIVAVVDVVVRLALCAATGALHGAVLVRIVVPTMRSEHVRRLSHGQMKTWTMRVHDDHARMLKEGEAYGKFQQSHLARQSDARS
jgi:hypothetical protein